MTPRELVESHLPLVEAIATRLLRQGIGRWKDRDEAIAWGMLGLCEAAAHYREGKGATFATYAFYRIRGAMIDGARLEGRHARRGEAHQKEWVPYTDDPFVLSRAAGITLPEARAFVADLVRGDPGGASLEEREETEALREAIAGLPERERALVEAVDLRGRQLTEAGEELGITKSWASRLRKGALGTLRERLS